MRSLENKQQFIFLISFRKILKKIEPYQIQIFLHDFLDWGDHSNESFGKIGANSFQFFSISKDQKIWLIGQRGFETSSVLFNEIKIHGADQCTFWVDNGGLCVDIYFNNQFRNLKMSFRTTRILMRNPVLSPTVSNLSNPYFLSTKSSLTNLFARLSLFLKTK